MDKHLKILVTGANGYIGSRVVKTLLDFGNDVIASDINNSHIDERAKFIKADIFSKQDNWFEFFDKPDVCLHLAWLDGFKHNSDKHMLFLSSHYEFLTNLINHGLKHLATMGTMHEVGYYEGAIDENTPCNPMSQYGIAKNALRASMLLFCKDKDVTFQWLRAFYIYGNDKYGASIFCKIQQSASEGNKTFPFTTGRNKYDFIEVNELAKQISLSIMQEEVNGVINCCSGIPISLADKVENYIKENNLSIKLEYGKYPDRKYDSPCVYGDNSKILKILNNSKK